MTTPAAITLLTVEEVADYLRLTPRTIRRMAAGDNPALRGSKVGGQWRFDAADVEAYLKETQNRDRRKRRRNKEAFRSMRSAAHGPGRVG